MSIVFYFITKSLAFYCVFSPLLVCENPYLTNHNKPNVALFLIMFGVALGFLDLFCNAMEPQREAFHHSISPDLFSWSNKGPIEYSTYLVVS